LIQPDEQAPGHYQFWYAPVLTKLTTDSMVITGMIETFRDYVIIDAAIKVLTKEESDTMPLEKQKMAILKRIEDMAANRDVGATDRIGDAQYNKYWLFPYEW
jgi:hypothetical protein